MDDVDLGNPRCVEATIQLAMAFEKAMSLFQIKAYDGAINLLLSTDNLSRKKWGDSPKLKSCFSGDVRISEIARSHGEILDIRNQAFARHLTDCLRQAHELAALTVNANCARPKSGRRDTIGSLRAARSFASSLVL